MKRRATKGQSEGPLAKSFVSLPSSELIANVQHSLIITDDLWFFVHCIFRICVLVSMILENGSFGSPFWHKFKAICFKTLLLSEEMSPYFEVFKNNYEEHDYHDFRLLNLIIQIVSKRVLQLLKRI
jgi:hypothetical protein